MIEWKKVGEIQTIDNVDYLLTGNGGWIMIGRLKRGKWVERNGWDGIDGVTHYAEINLPEDTHD